MTPGEITDASESELSARRLALLQALCPVCDKGDVLAECSCTEDLREVELVEAELRVRWREGL